LLASHLRLLLNKNMMHQWFLKITNYAEELLADLDTLKGWPERVRVMQQNWIGKSQGAELYFKVKEQARAARSRYSPLALILLLVSAIWFSLQKILWLSSSLRPENKAKVEEYVRAVEEEDRTRSHDH
jgi:leucyl-tRNA synthetase